MSVTSHWLDREFADHHKCLAVKRVPRTESSDFIATRLNDVIDDVSLDRNDLCLIVSGAAAVKQAVSQVLSIYVLILVFKFTFAQFRQIPRFSL